MRAKTILLATLALLAAGGCKKSEQAAAPAPDTAAVAAAGAATPGPTPASWLDRPLENWNTPGMEIPRAPMMEVDDATKERCAQQERPKGTAEDDLVAAAGWKLFGPLQKFGSGTMVSGMATVDAMCRPRFMQTFVFSNGKFVGTIAPGPMESRTDGAQRYAFMPGEDYVVAEFARYAPEDPLCCPSRFSTVVYGIKSETGPVLAPAEVSTQEAARQKAGG